MPPSWSASARSTPRPASSTSASSATASRPRPPGSATSGSARSPTSPSSSTERPAIDRVVVCSGAVGSLELATPARPEQLGGPEVVVHAGLPGIDASRITVSAVANEALLRVAPSTPSLAGRFVKRAFDIVVAGALLLVAAPVFALVAILVKREDGGPVLFRQQRVGQ